MKIGKITKKQQHIWNKKASREIAIDLNLNHSKHKVHKSIKDYSRKKEKSVNWILLCD